MAKKTSDGPDLSDRLLLLLVLFGAALIAAELARNVLAVAR